VYTFPPHIDYPKIYKPLKALKKSNGQAACCAGAHGAFIAFIPSAGNNKQSSSLLDCLFP